MHLAPVGSHLFAILAAGVEVGDLVGSEHIVHILGELGLEGTHHRELLAHENLGEQLVRAREDHGLLLEVLDMRALGEKLWHVAHLVAGFACKQFAGAWKYGGADEDRHIGETADELLHEGQILGAVVLGGDVDLEEGDVDMAEVVVVALGRVADEELAVGVVVLQPILQRSTHEAASDNSNVNHGVYWCKGVFV